MSFNRLLVCVLSDIKVLEKKLKQIDYKIMMEKNRDRLKDKKRKTSLGKILILAGANHYYSEKIRSQKEVIALGALFYIAKIEKIKLAVLLGGCYDNFEKLENGKIEKLDIINLADRYYENYYFTRERKSKESKIEKLEYPLNLFLGVILNIKSGIEENEIINYEKMGDSIFSRKYNR